MPRHPDRDDPKSVAPRRPTLVRGEGLYAWDSEGRRYLDAISGAFCVQLGYGRADLAETLKEAAGRLPFARPATSDSAESLAYARELLERAGPPFTRVIFTSSGSEAVEVAIKAAWRYQEAIGHPERFRIERVAGHLHGATIGALEVTGYEPRRSPYARHLGSAVALPPAYFTDPAAAGGLGGAEPAGIAALIAETIPAAGLGAPVPPPGYLARVRAACDAAGALWIADEVLTGFGRVGDLFAWSRLRERNEDTAAIPDLVVFGKGAGGGYAAIGGVLFGARVAEALESGPGGGFSHAQTYGGHAIACAVARRVLAALEEDGCAARVRALEAEAREALESVSAHPSVSDVRGIGFLYGIEIVADRITGTPFDRELRIAERVEAACGKRGLLVYAGTGCAGARGDHLLIGPPLTAGPSDFRGIADGIAEALDEVVETSAVRR